MLPEQCVFHIASQRKQINDGRIEMKQSKKTNKQRPIEHHPVEQLEIPVV
jgi:hypothetical protein